MMKEVFKVIIIIGLLHLVLVSGNQIFNIFNYSLREIEMMARMVCAESENEPFAGKVAVAAVILNREKHHQFPNDIESVIFQSSQFSPLLDGRYWTVEPRFIHTWAVIRAIWGYDPSYGSLFFQNPSTRTNYWQDENTYVVTVIGNHEFRHP